MNSTVTLLLALVLLTGCGKKSLPHEFPEPAWFVTGHWIDSTVYEPHKRRELVCESSHEIVGRVDSYAAETTWDSNVTAPRVGWFPSSLYKEYENESAARMAVEKFALANNLCTREPK